MHPRIGVSSKVYWGRHHDLSFIINHVAQHAKIIEIWTEFPAAKSFDVVFDPQKQLEIEQALASTSLTPTLHATFHELNIASPNNRMRSLALDELRRNIDFAHHIGAKIITVHAGKKREGFERHKALALMAESLDALQRAAEPYGITVSLENMAAFEATGGFGNNLCIWPEELKEVLSETRSPVKMTLDVAHMETVPHVDYEEFVVGLRKWLVHTHLADIRNKMHIYMPIGSGTVRWDRALSLLRKIKYKGYFIIEGWINAYQDRFLDLEIQNLENLLKKYFEGRPPKETLEGRHGAGILGALVRR